MASEEGVSVDNAVDQALESFADCAEQDPKSVGEESQGACEGAAEAATTAAEAPAGLEHGGAGPESGAGPEVEPGAVEEPSEPSGKDAANTSVDDSGDVASGKAVAEAEEAAAASVGSPEKAEDEDGASTVAKQSSPAGQSEELGSSSSAAVVEKPGGSARVSRPGGVAIGTGVKSKSSSGPGKQVEGGLGMGPPGMPTAGSLPQALAPGCTLPPQGPASCSSDCCPHPPGADAKSGVEKVDLPPAVHKYKEGRLRTTVNTPETLVTEADPEPPLEPEQYMFYAQQYAALAQQYAAYAQYCAQYAPQAATAAAIAGGGMPPGQLPPAMVPPGASQAAPSSAVATAPSGNGNGGDAAAAPQSGQGQPKNMPIMVTPYRHNWLISGSHRNSDKDGTWYDGIKGDVKNSISVLGKYVGGCRQCTPGTDGSQCRQM
mmetsp:Transcript_58959/g.140762  ORF Transcript_58959/g.140762 Transcript_58959/m.140762 type:complete len:432 (+) Transcript_58959:58-1353(+)